MNKKLKKKIWTISTTVLLVYIVSLILKPTIWTVLLPIIISSGALTFGIPGYAIIKNSKDSLKKAAEKQELSIQKDKENNIEIEKIKINSNNKTIDNENNIIVDMQSEEELIQGKPKIKTKGTIC